MPNSQHSSLPPLNDLRSYLQQALPESELTEAAVAPPHNPLLMLRTNHVLAAFAFSNGDVRNSYENIYSGFKQFYAGQQGHWDRLDLAFVFCVRPDLPSLDQFCSNVETDVYFCRKFVVPLTKPVGLSLARLPFLPLAPLSGRSLRPPSAQTFLHQCGTPTVLAKYIVVPGRSPQTIVDDCINGDYGSPSQLTPTGDGLIAQPDHTAEPVRLESLTIKNFRAYREAQTFDLGADVTVLYGANGFGKTSVFDAFDFATTGDIGRIKFHGEQHFRKTATHLDSRPEDSSVSLNFWTNGALRRFTRTVIDRKNGLLDGIRTDRKSLLSELTNGEFPATDRVENFVSLFRATHLFNQEQPELTKDFREDCRLPSEIVARMLAFEDYASASSKAVKIREHIDSIIADANGQMAQLGEQLALDKDELSRLGRITLANTPREDLDAELSALAIKLANIGLSIEPGNIDASALRNWRAAIEGRLAASRSRSERLSALIPELGDLASRKAEATQLQQSLVEQEQALGGAAERRALAEAAVKEAAQQLAELNVSITQAQERIDAIKWLRSKKALFDQLVVREERATKVLSDATNSLVQDRANEEAIVGQLRLAEQTISRVSETAELSKSNLQALDSLAQAIPAWLENLAKLNDLAKSEKDGTETVETLRVKAQDLATRSIAVAAEESRLARSLAEVDKSQSELKSLASKLAALVQSGTCPLCGEDHGSRDELLHRIELHLTLDVTGGVRAGLTEARDRVKDLTTQTEENTASQQAAEQWIRNLAGQRADLETAIGQFAASAERIGLSLEASTQARTRQLQSIRKRVEQEVGEHERQLSESNADAVAIRLRLREVQDRIKARSSEIEEQTKILAQVRPEIAELRRDPRAISLPLATSSEQLSSLENSAEGSMGELRSQLEAAQQTVAHTRAELGRIDQELVGLRTQITAQRTQLGKLQKLESEITARIKQEDLPIDCSQDLVRSRISEESRMQAQLAALRDSTANLELAVDTATTSAALTQIRQNVRTKEKAITAALARKEQHEPWGEYFAEVVRLVASKQSEAIASFTREYGPRTSVIQRRLRSVYGFDEVDISSKESEIRVRVKRRGEELRPTDYFSQSQQQTLFLGLFLTACISQTWSAFSPVFLDDPVTHFDDLNTYAFLDLVVGLLEPGPWKRQFVISTCDEKLLQLARQKFRHLGDRAKFYRFSSIGEDGPTVEAVG